MLDLTRVDPRRPAARGEIQAELIRRAVEGSLSITELLTLPDPRVSELCGQILLGQRDQSTEGPDHMQCTNAVGGHHVPEELASCPVKIRCTGRCVDPSDSLFHRIVWSQGTVEDSFLRRVRGASYGLGEGEANHAVMVKDDQREVLCDENGIASVPAPSAWLILRQFGEGIVRCRRVSARRGAWRYAEVPPAIEVEKPVPPAPRKKQTFSEANRPERSHA